MKTIVVCDAFLSFQHKFDYFKDFVTCTSLMFNGNHYTRITQNEHIQNLMQQIECTVTLGLRSRTNLFIIICVHGLLFITNCHVKKKNQQVYLVYCGCSLMSNPAFFTLVPTGHHIKIPVWTLVPVNVLQGVCFSTKNAKEHAKYQYIRRQKMHLREKKKAFDLHSSLFFKFLAEFSPAPLHNETPPLECFHFC